MPKGKLIWLRAETFIHAGVGQQASVVDLPFAREGATGYPYIPGSAVKGALRDAYWLGERGDAPWPTDPEEEEASKTNPLDDEKANIASQLDEEKASITNPVDKEKASITNPVDKEKASFTNRLFGMGDDSGKILFSDARLAFLPLRTLGNTYRYVTSCGLLRRLSRDHAFVGGQSWQAPNLAWNNPDQVFGPPGTGKIYLEEFPFDAQPLNGFSDIPGLLTTEVWNDIKAKIAILNDDDFDYFARHGLFVRQRNALEAATKTAKGTALWSEESLPSDTLMYVVLTPRLPGQTGHLDDLIETLRDRCGGYFQVGGNETVGEGWFKMLKSGAGRTSYGRPESAWGGGGEGMNTNRDLLRMQHVRKGGMTLLTHLPKEKHKEAWKSYKKGFDDLAGAVLVGGVYRRCCCRSRGAAIRAET